MPTVSTLHRHGDLVHPELVCADLDATCEFYTPLLGWDYVPGVVGPHAIATVEGVHCAGLAHTVTRTDGVPLGWTPYLAAEDLDATCEAIVEHGGRVVQPPSDIGEVGRIAFVADPHGAVFGLWRGGPVEGLHRLGEPGTLCLAHLVTPDIRRSARFYEAVFGIEPAAGGLLGAPPLVVTERRQHDARWVCYLGVDDLGAALEAVTAKGGRVVEAPAARWDRRTAVVSDPTGAAFGLVESEG